MENRPESLCEPKNPQNKNDLNPKIFEPILSGQHRPESPTTTTIP
jgi:hypothetical protein